LTQESVARRVVERVPEGDQASPKHDPQAELLEAAEAALDWLRSCSPMDPEERLDREADLRVRLRRAIRGARRRS
jgi:hypothetical protein